MCLKDEILIRDLIRDEEEAIVGYEKAICEVQDADLVKVLEDIKNEELVHIGELKMCLSKIGVYDEDKYMEGAEEAAEKLLEAVKELHSVFHK